MMHALQPVCPAATVVNPPPAGDGHGGPTVICGVLENGNRAALGRGKGKNRGATSATFRQDERPAVEGAPNQTQSFCCGQGIPGGAGHHAFDVQTGEANRRCSYTQCRLWRGDKEATWTAMQLRNGDLNLPDVQRRTPREAPVFQDA